MTSTVGIIGLGNMGRGIARNIAKAGHGILVWDLSEPAREAFSDIAEICPPPEMAARADFVIFVVPGSPQIEEILGPMLEKAAPGLVLWDFTTSDPVHTKRLAARAAESASPTWTPG